MFGIGFSELVIIVIIVLIAVGPDRLPTMMKTAGKVMRDVRKATDDLKAASGLNELLDDPDIRELRGGVSLSPAAVKPGAPPSRKPLSRQAKDREQPPEGVDVAVFAARLTPQTTGEDPSSTS